MKRKMLSLVVMTTTVMALGLNCIPNVGNLTNLLGLGG